MSRAVVRSAALVLTLLTLASAPPAWAQDSKSGALARQLIAALDAAKMDSIAAKDPSGTDVYCAALYFAGSPLLVVAAKYSAPQLLNERLTKKEYGEIYADLSAASVAGSKVFVMDTFADGLVAKPKGDSPADSVERGTATVAFDGDAKKAKMSDAEYAKAFSECDDAYARILQLLITKLKSGT